MKLKTLVTSLALVLAAPAFAAIAPGSSGNGELFLVVQDAAAKVSFAFDTGIRMDDFIANAEAATPVSWTFDLAGNSIWADFKANYAEETSSWALLALDSTGAITTKGAQRLLTTLKNTQTIVNITNTTNQKLAAGIAPTTAGNFFNNVNNTGTHGPQTDLTVNGSSINADPTNGYFGKSPGLTANLNNNASFTNTNLYGESSSFFYVTAGAGGTTAKAFASQYFQPGGNPVTIGFANDTLTLAVPEPGTYALMVAGLAAVGFMARRRRA